MPSVPSRTKTGLLTGSVVPKANVWRASSSGKLSREKAAGWYTNFEPRVTIDDAMRKAKLVRKSAAGVQK